MLERLQPAAVQQNIAEQDYGYMAGGQMLPTLFNTYSVSHLSLGQYMVLHFTSNVPEKAPN